MNKNEYSLLMASSSVFIYYTSCLLINNGQNLNDSLECKKKKNLICIHSFIHAYIHYIPNYKILMSPSFKHP